MIFNKVYRKLPEYINKLSSLLRIVHLTLQYPSLRIKIGSNTYIGKNCKIVCVDGGKMILENVYINYGCFIYCEQGATLTIKNSYIGMNSVIVAVNSIDIENNCEIAEMVVIRDQNHKHDLSDTPIAKQGLDAASIVIGSNVWVGAKATILKGVRIGKNSIVGANAVVTKSYPEQSIIAGVPAKKINK